MLYLDFSIFPILKTERMLLRELCEADGEALFAMCSDERVMEHIGRKKATTLQDALDLIARTIDERKKNIGVTWGLTLHGDDTLIGTVGYYRLQKAHYRGEIGYLLAYENWKKGLMSEAVHAAVDHGFGPMGFHSIEAITDPANEPSWQLLERCGFVRDGLFKENFYWDGHFYDSVVYSKLAHPESLS